MEPYERGGSAASGPAPSDFWTPHGLKAISGWTPFMGIPTAQNQPSSGQVSIVRIPIPQTLVVTNVACQVEVAGSGLTAGQNFIGLYTSAFALIGTSADQAAAWASTGWKPAALTGGPYTIQGGLGVYVYGALLAVGTTRPQFKHYSPPNTAIRDTGMSAGALWAMQGATGQTSLPATVTGGSFEHAYLMGLS